MRKVIKFCLNRMIVITFGIIICIVFGGYSLAQNDVLVSNVVTVDIQAGIEKYIEDEAVRGGGYFNFSSDGKEYLFKLVRVHTEYLANLGPGRHFACVDLVDTSGDVYDVDFFLSGDPGAMIVTETTLHKLNGIPFYAWKQNKEGLWERVPIDNASPQLLGVITGQDEFEFIYKVKLPEITDNARMWIPLAVTDAFQKVKIKTVQSPKDHKILTEAKHGNKAFYFELGKKDSKKTIEIVYQVQRIEKAAYTPLLDDLEKSLKADRLVPIDDKFKDIAEEVVINK